VGSGEVWKSSGRLADGREIIYFDEAPGQGRADIPDSRDLPARNPGRGSGPDGSGLRWDALLGEWIAIAENRQDRTFLPAAGSCPLCPSRPGCATEIPASSYDVVVFENRFPVFSGTAAGGQDGAPDLAAWRPSTGRCEMVCFTPEHDSSFARLSPRQAGTVIAAWADRTAELGRTPGIEHVFCFENRGEEVGATLQHPHGQIYALPFVPPRTNQLLGRARAHRAAAGGNLFDGLLAAEVADGRRLVQHNEHWVAFVPRAARWPFEVLVFPMARVPDLAALSGIARASLAEIYPAVLRRLDALFGMPMPYMAAWQQAPSSDPDARPEFGLFLQIMATRRAPGKLKYMASTESGAGVWSNDVLPETAARMLREAADG
jgi:UDPglucose--hexose-1-phosphate uridylyltransferase